MAYKSRIEGITVQIGGDTTGLSKALGGINSQIGTTKSQLKDVERLLKLDPKNTELLRQKQKLLKEEISETKEKLQSLKEAEKQVQQQMKEGKVSQEQYDKLRREIIETETSLKNLEKQASRSITALVRIGQVGESFQKVGDKIEDVGQKLIPVTGAIVGLGAAVVKTTADFDAAMSEVAAISGATGDDLEALRDKAREMGAQTKFSASEAAEAMKYMAMAGWKTDDMLDGLKGIMDLAAASGESLASTSDIVTDALTAFGLSAEDSARFADVLSAASSNANTNVSMLGESFKYVAPVAGAMGYSAEDTAIALGLMANAGIKASNGGTALRTMLVNMSKPTDEMAAAMDALGISLEDADGDMISMLDVLKQLRAGFSQGAGWSEELEERLWKLSEELEKGETTGEDFSDALNAIYVEAYGAEGALKAEYAAMLAGKTGMAGLLAIVNASEEDFEKLTEAIYNSNGVTEEMAATMQDNLTGQFTILKSQLEELSISIGEMLMPYIREFVGWLQSLVDWLNNLDEGTKGTIVTIALLVAGLGPVLIVIGKIISAMGSLMVTISKIGPIVTGIGKVFSSVFSFIAANPIVLLIAAIVALVALVAAKGDEAQAILQKVDDFLQGIFLVDWVQVFGPGLGDAMNAFFANMKNVWDSTKKIFDGVIDFIRGVFTGDWERAWNGLVTIGVGIMSGLGAMLKAPFNGVIAMMNSLVNGVNWMIDKINSISIDIPSWLGGGHIGFSLDKLANIPYLAKGGILTKGSAVVGEAGPELLTLAGGQAVVQPLTNQQTTNNNTNLGGITLNVYGAPGQDVNELADIISEKISNVTARQEAVYS